MSEECKQIGVLSSPAELASLLLHMSGHTKPVCAVNGVLHDDFGQVHCARVTGWCGSKICTSREYCEHQRERR